jgi:hypothetical protein
MKIQAAKRLLAFVSHDPREAPVFLKMLGCQIDPVPLMHQKYYYNFAVSEGTDLEAMCKRISSKVFKAIEVVPVAKNIRLLGKLQKNLTWHLSPTTSLTLIELNVGLPNERQYFQLIDKHDTSTIDFGTLTKIFK